MLSFVLASIPVNQFALNCLMTVITFINNSLCPRGAVCCLHCSLLPLLERGVFVHFGGIVAKVRKPLIA